MNNKKKALIVTTVGSTVDQFVMPSIRLLIEMGYEVEVACNFHGENTCTDLQINRMKKRFDEMGVKYHQIDYCRNMFKLHRILKGRRQLKKVIREEHYDLIHCHTPIAGAVIRTLANKDRKAGKTRVVYTAHGFHFYKGSSIASWMIFYPIEKLCSRMTDVLITMNRDDYELSRNKMKAARNVYIPGIGIDIEGIPSRLLPEAEKEEFRKKIGLYNEKDGSRRKMFLSVGEINKNKNHAAVIRALAGFGKNHPDVDWKYYICGKGVLKDSHIELAKELDIADRIVFTGFTDEIMKYYACADLFIFPSYREGLSVAMMEAIASKLPVICSDIRGNRELVPAEARFDPSDSAQITEKIEMMLEPDKSEQIVKESLRMLQKCDAKEVQEQLRKVYEGLWE